MIVTDPGISKINGFVGNIIQQATSVVTKTNQRCYELVEDCYSVYAFEVMYLHPFILAGQCYSLSIHPSTSQVSNSVTKSYRAVPIYLPYPH